MFTGTLLVLDCHSYYNNSIVTLDDIAEGSEALMCYTDREDCCNLGIRSGEWYYPNGRQVGTNGTGTGFYRNRGPSVVSLHRRENIVMPVGVFHCEIPYGNGYSHIYVGVYSQGQGNNLFRRLATKCYVLNNMYYTGNPNMMEIELGTHRGLTCTSTGGPVTTVTWRRDGQLLTINESTYQQSQRIVSTENATYETTLHIANNNIENYHATYECLVLNSRGSDSSSITLEGKDNRMLKITNM